VRIPISFRPPFRFDAGRLRTGRELDALMAKRFAPSRLSRGFFGDKGIFARRGVTEKAIRAEEKHGLRNVAFVPLYGL